MKTLYVHTPMWKNRENREIGVGEYWFKNDNWLKIEILYKNKEGERIHPGIFYLSRDNAFIHPVQILPTGMRLRIIPIADLEKQIPLHDEPPLIQGIPRELILAIPIKMGNGEEAQKKLRMIRELVGI